MLRIAALAIYETVGSNLNRILIIKQNIMKTNRQLITPMKLLLLVLTFAIFPNLSFSQDNSDSQNSQIYLD